MKRLGDWLQVCANLGILAGLVLVGLQMQQNERLLKIQLVNQYNDASAGGDVAVGGEEIAAIWAKSVETPEALTLADMRALESVLFEPPFLPAELEDQISAVVAEQTNGIGLMYSGIKRRALEIQASYPNL